MENYYNTSIRRYSDSLEGIFLKVVAYEDPDYIHKLRILRHGNGSIEFESGMCLELLRVLQDTLKFKYVPLEDVTYIRQFPNKTLYGMAARILTGDADFAMAQASMVMLQMPGSHSHFRGIPFISYLIPTSTMKLTAIFRQPDAHTTRNIVVSTFTTKIWAYWFILWLLILISLLATHVCLQRLETNRRFVNRKVNRFDFTESVVLCVISNMTCQGWFKYPRESPLRWMFMIAMTYAYLTNIFFSAGLTSNLASETDSIKTFDDLKLSDLRLYGDRRLPVVENYLKEIYSTTLSRKGKLKLDAHGHLNLTSHLVMIPNSTSIIKRTSSAFITFDDAARTVFQSQGHSDKYFCESISAVAVSSRAFPNAMFVKRGSYLRELFNRKLLLAMERGIMHRINSIYFSFTIVSCMKPSNNYRGGLGIEDLDTAFNFLFMGIASSLVVLIGVKLVDLFYNPKIEPGFIL